MFVLASIGLLGPPGPTHANQRARQTVAPAPHGLHPWRPRRLGVLIAFVELYGQIAALQPDDPRNSRFMLICCRRATETLAALQHWPRQKAGLDGPAFWFRVFRP